MPGINVVIEKKRTANKEEVFSKIAKIPTIRKQNIISHYENENTLIFSNIYDNYPTTRWENNDCIFIIEGLILDNNNEKRLQSLTELSKFVALKKQSQKELGKWLLNNDGDYVIVIINKLTQDVFLLNDPLCKLPIYYYNSENNIIISRNIKNILAIAGSENIEFDKIGIAQYLMFDNPIGKRTLFKDIGKLEPSNIITVSLKTLNLEIDEVNKLDFDLKSNSNKSVKENAKALKEILEENCKQTFANFPEFKSLLSLSGGLDSRLVAACLKNLNIEFEGATFSEFHNLSAGDIEYAEKIATILDVPYKIYQLNYPKGSDVRLLINSFTGSVYTGMSFIIPFYKEILEKYGTKQLYVTGETGLDIRNYLPHRNLSNMDELVNYILSNKTSMPIDLVCKLVGITKETLIAELEHELLNYPEKEFNQKYQHFYYLNYNLYLCIDGMDRSREYFWTITPLDTTRFFYYAINCPDNQKKYYRLYAELMNAVSNKMAELINPKWGVSIISKKFRRKMIYEDKKLKTFNLLPKTITKTIKRKVYNNIRNKENTFKTPFVSCLKEQFTNSSELNKQLNYNEIINLIENEGISKRQFHNLFTITSVIQNISDSNKSIDNYLNSEYLL